MPEKKRGIFYGWWVVAAAGTMSWYGAGVWFYGFSVVFRAILAEFGWARAVTAGAFSLSRLEGGLEGPFVGVLIDRVGPRKMAIIGSVIVGLGYILLSRISSVWMLYVLFGGVIAMGYNAGFSHAGTAAVANWFVKKRSRALGLYTLGAGVGGATMAPFIGWLITQYGWRTTVVLIGIGVWAITIPVSLLLRHKPEQYGMLPDGESPEEVVDPPELEETPDIEETYSKDKIKRVDYDFTWKETLATSTFWLLLLASSVRSVAMTSIVLHEVAYLTDIGIGEMAAAGALGLMVGLSIPGRVFFGWLGDRIDKRWVLMVSYILQAVGIYILANVKGINDVYIFVAVYGFGYGGAIPVYIALRGEFFGRKAFATIQGLQQMFLIPATMAGPIFAGWIYDTTGSYNFAFMLFMVMMLLGVAVLPFLRRPIPKSVQLARRESV